MPSAGQLLQKVEFGNTSLEISFDKPSKTWSLYENASGEWSTVLYDASFDLRAFNPEGNENTSTLDRHSGDVGLGTQLYLNMNDTCAHREVAFVLSPPRTARLVSLALPRLVAT